MILGNLNIEKIIIHEIHQRGENNLRVEPTIGRTLIDFDDIAMEGFKSRITEALGQDSKAVQMEISNESIQSTAEISTGLPELALSEFVNCSEVIANKLTDTQNSRIIPGGILVVFTGTYGRLNKKIIGIMKADIYSGYQKETNSQTQKISLKYIEELLLTPSSKLYKTAAFFERNEPIESESETLNNIWSVYINDNQVSAKGKAGANYFVSNFLGFDYLKSSARTTKLFFTEAKNYIISSDLEQDKKTDILNALVTYIKVDNSSSISCREFGDAYFESDMSDEFCEYMYENEVPNVAFSKDIELISSDLKSRRLKFKNNVSFSAPAEAFEDYLEIESFEAAANASEESQIWTRITIKDEIKSQE